VLLLVVLNPQNKTTVTITTLAMQYTLSNTKAKNKKPESRMNKTEI
jgi:hypothetical protein